MCCSYIIFASCAKGYIPTLSAIFLMKLGVLPSETLTIKELFILLCQLVFTPDEHHFSLYNFSLVIVTTAYLGTIERMISTFVIPPALLAPSNLKLPLDNKFCKLRLLKEVKLLVKRLSHDI